MSKCPSCDYSSENLIGLSVHFRKKHKGTAKQLRIELFHDGVEPTCACNCGSSVKFMAIQLGFSKYAWGHQARVKNNWGHNKEALEKSQDRRREQIVAGEWEPWNKGETSETDERLKVNGLKASETFRAQPELLKRRSDDMKLQWETGAITPLMGSAHPRWKGGVSSLQQLSRSYLYRVWSRPKMAQANFICQRCGGPGGDLEVHHDKEKFAQILQKAMEHFHVIDATQLTFDQKQELVLWIIDYHVDNDVSGIVLCVNCHEKEHAHA